jgi:tetratricopeptide (TPR) repeat protein
MDGNITSGDEPYVAAQRLAAAHRYTEAVDAYSGAINVDPNNIKARLGRGLALQRIGDHTRALSDFDCIIKQFGQWPGLYAVYYSRAVSRNALGQSAGAIEDCNEALKTDPKNADALYLRGIARRDLGQTDAAMTDMDAVLAMDPNYDEAHSVRGQLNMLNRRWHRAIADLGFPIERGAWSTEDRRRCLYMRGIAAQELGDHCRAIADFTRAIELAPCDQGAYLRRARSYKAIGEPQLADTDLRIGTQTRPEAPKP